MRYFLEFSYFGKRFHGWQRQPNALSVQQVLEEALSLLLSCPTEVVGAGRTDAGVHARQSFAHFDAPEALDENLVFRLNRFLPPDIAVIRLHQVKAGAHARFDAIERSYEYAISCHKDVFSTETAFFFGKKLDIDMMNEAAAMLLQHQDFECFSRSRTDVKTYICHITRAAWKKTPQGLVFEISADRFLRNMVRAIVGTLLLVGQGKISLQDMHQIMESKDRRNAGSSVPAHGLFLVSIQYPNKIFV